MFTPCSCELRISRNKVEANDCTAELDQFAKQVVFLALQDAVMDEETLLRKAIEITALSHPGSMEAALWTSVLRAIYYLDSWCMYVRCFRFPVTFHLLRHSSQGTKKLGWDQVIRGRKPDKKPLGMW